MKKLLIPFLVIPLLFSCSDDFGIPEKVSIKVDSSYEFAVGDFSQDISEYLSIDTIRDSMNNNSDDEKQFTVYDYNPGKSSKELQQFLVEFDIEELDIDMGGYLSNLDITESLEQTNFNQEFNIPSFDLNDTDLKVELPDFNESVRNKADFGSYEVPIPGGINSAIEDISLPIEVQAPSFTTMEFKSGYLQARITSPSTVPPSMWVKLELAIGNKKSGTVLLYGPDSSDVASIPLEGLELGPEFYITISGSSSGGDLTTYNYDLSISFSDDMKLSKVTGLTMDKEDVGAITLDENVSLAGSNQLVDCQINKGSLSTKIALPSGWSGIKVYDSDSPITVSAFTGGSFVDNEDTTGYILNKTMTLDGLIYSPTNNSINISGSLDVSLDNATLILDGVDEELPLDLYFDVTSLDWVTLDMSSSGSELGFSESTDLGDANDYVKKIYTEVKAGSADGLDPDTVVGLKIDYKNTLPEGNDITIGFNSDFLEISNSSSILEAHGENAQTAASYISQAVGEHEIAVTEDSEIDYEVKLSLPHKTERDYSSYANHEQFVTLSNIEIGSTYNLELTVVPEFNWTAMDIDLAALNANTEFDGSYNTGFASDSIFDSLAENFDNKEDVEKLEVKNIPFYMYCVVPDTLSSENSPFGTFTANGNAIAFIDENNPTILIGDSNTGDKVGINLLSSLPTLEQDEDDVVITDLRDESISNSGTGDIANLFNDHGSETIKISYDIKLTSSTSSEEPVHVTKEQLDEMEDENGEPQTKIQIKARFVMPLELGITSDIKMNVLKLADKDNGDLFDRDEETDLDDIEKYLDIIEEVSVNYTATNNLLVYSNSSKYATLTIEDDKVFDEPKSLSTKSGKQKFKLTGAEVKNALKTYPFEPKIMMNIPATTDLNDPNSCIRIPRDAEISLNMNVKVDANGTVAIFGD